MNSTNARPGRPARSGLRRAVLAGSTSALSLASGLAAAQSTPPPAPSSAAAAAGALPSVTITGNPLRSSEVATPSSTLSGDELVQRRGSTLGETLDGLPGVSSSWFGPNANRPVIRGQDGDRIRVLGNGGASLDASSLSNDHAVPIDPLAVERIEVLRGPAALMYGGSAVGGVVNAIDNRIPRSGLVGTSGAAEVRLGGAADERGTSALVETGGNGLNLHVDGFYRKTSDLRVPSFDRPAEGGGTERVDRVINSAAEAKGGALGVSRTWADGYAGVALDTYRNDYGTVAEENVLIRMKRDKIATAGEWRNLGSDGGLIETVRAQLAASRYEHVEVEGGNIGTTFKNRGVDGRVEAELRHFDLAGGRVRGVVGVQGEDSRFSALGEEGFVPNTTTRQLAGFVFQEWQRGPLTLNAGVRGEHVEVHADANPDLDLPDDVTRRYTPLSGALGSVWALDPHWKLTGQFAYTERAPTFYELFAKGEHVATAAYEEGDIGQQKERGRNLDLAVEWKDGANSARLGVFESRFSRYIALLQSSEPSPVLGLPLYQFTGVPARLRGIEAEGRWRAWESTSTLDITGKLDLLRAERTDTGEPLPRIAPLRITLGTQWTRGPWQLGGEVVRAQRQDRVPSNDTPTPGYTIVNASGSYRFDLYGSDALWFVKLQNLGNELAYNAASVATVRALSPLPGRSLMAGLRVSF